MKLSIIIIVYNGFHHLKNCLASLYKDLPEKTEIIIIDNASTEKGLNELLQQFPLVHSIKNKINFGFAKGVNMGIKKSKGTYVLILNPDTKVLPGTLKTLITIFDKNTSLQLGGCNIVNSHGKLQQSAGYAYPNLLSHLYEYNQIFYKIMSTVFPRYHPIWYSLSKHKKQMEVTHIIGAFLFLRKSVVKRIGYFDEGFFLYREETDFCQRLTKNGYVIAYIPVRGGGVVHIGGGSSQLQLTQASPYYMESTYHYFNKYHSKLYVSIAYAIGLFSAYVSLVSIWTTEFFKHSLQKNNTKERLLSWKQIIDWHVKNRSLFFL